MLREHTAVPTALKGGRVGGRVVEDIYLTYSHQLTVCPFRSVWFCWEQEVDVHPGARASMWRQNNCSETYPSIDPSTYVH